jgi:hypothetical protein
MLRTYLRDELNLLMRHDILSMDEVLGAVEIGASASFLDRAPTIETSVGGRTDPSRSDAVMTVEVGI